MVGKSGAGLVVQVAGVQQGLRARGRHGVAFGRCLGHGPSSRRIPGPDVPCSSGCRDLGSGLGATGKGPLPIPLPCCTGQQRLALEGMQPTFRQVPPRVPRPSTQVVFRPSWAALMAATYPPGPPPMTTRSCGAVRMEVVSPSRDAHTNQTKFRHLHAPGPRWWQSRGAMAAPRWGGKRPGHRPSCELGPDSAACWRDWQEKAL